MDNYLRKFALALAGIFSLSLLCGTLIAQTATPVSDVPHTISYQGVLSGTDGKPVPDGTYMVTLRLYSDAAGTTNIWQDVMSAQTTNGVFSVMLGSGTAPLPMNAMNAPLYLGVQPAGQDEMRPLTALTASPYALAIPNASVTADKMATLYVPQFM